MNKTCKNCGEPLTRKQGEAQSAFARRRSCGRSCSAKARYSAPSEARPYRSRLGQHWLGAAQFLAEGMCLRLAKRDRREIGDGFWNSEAWAKEFVLQTVHASKLLKDFSLEAIIAALKTTRGQKVYSLGLRSVIVPLAKLEQERLDRAAKAREEAPVVEEAPASDSARPQIQTGNSILAKLKGL